MGGKSAQEFEMVLVAPAPVNAIDRKGR